MSCYEWEFGSIKLPAKQYTPFRKEIVAHVKADLERQLKAVNHLRDTILAENKGKRDVDFREAFFSKCERHKIDGGVIYRMFDGIPKTKRPNKMTRKAMHFPKATETSFGVADGEGSIVFDTATKTVSWGVGENNRSIERCRNTSVARLFFYTLNHMTWTRGSGGVITGNDEYNRDDHCEGGGGNYVTGRYGNV